MHSGCQVHELITLCLHNNALLQNIVIYHVSDVSKFNRISIQFFALIWTFIVFTFDSAFLNKNWIYISLLQRLHSNKMLFIRLNTFCYFLCTSNTLKIANMQTPTTIHRVFLHWWPNAIISVKFLIWWKLCTDPWYVSSIKKS
jgi:hypothetical protein